MPRGALVFFLQRLDVSSSYTRSAEVRLGGPVLSQHAFCRLAATPDKACCLNVQGGASVLARPLARSGTREREILRREAAILPLLRTKRGGIARILRARLA